MENTKHFVCVLYIMVIMVFSNTIVYKIYCSCCKNQLFRYKTHRRCIVIRISIHKYKHTLQGHLFSIYDIGMTTNIYFVNVVKSCMYLSIIVSSHNSSNSILRNLPYNNKHTIVGAKSICSYQSFHLFSFSAHRTLLGCCCSYVSRINRWKLAHSAR